MSDPLLSEDPPEDQGARTAGWYDFQHHCVLRLLLGMLVREEAGAVILETHEDALLLGPKGTVSEAISVKHRDDSGPWTLRSLIEQGGLRHLFDTWNRAGQSIGVRLMSNATLNTGRRGAHRLTATEPDAGALAEVAALLESHPETVRRFRDALTVDRLPHRWDVEAKQTAQLLLPVLTRYGLPLDRRERAYRAALHLVAERSKDRDPLDQEARLAILDRATRVELEREARLAARTVTTEQLLAALAAAASAPFEPTRHFEVHPFLMPKAEVRREKALREVSEKIDEPTNRLVALVALGGEGKSTVAKQYVVGPAEERFDVTFSFSFRSDSPETFLGEACRVFLPGDDGDGGPFQQARRLAGTLREVRALLVLHEFECALVREKGVDRGKLESRELREFLALLLSAPESRSVVLATSRLLPVEFKEVQGFNQYELEPLDAREVVEYLRKRDISGRKGQLAKAGRRFGGHALTIAALADYLHRSEWNGSIKGVKSFRSLPPDRQGRTRAVLDNYRRLLSDQAQDVLIAIAAASEGPRRDDLVSVGQSMGMSREELEEVFEALEDSVLLRWASEEDDAIVSTHPLVADYFLECSDAARVEGVRTALRRQYVSRMPPGCAESLDEAKPGIAAFTQSVALGDWEGATELYFKRLPVPRELFWAGHYRICRELTNPLLMAWKKGEHQFESDQLAYLLANLGRVEAKTGDVDRALAAFDEAAAADPGSPGHLRGVLYGIEVALEGGRCRLARERMHAARANTDINVGDYRVGGRMGYLEACAGNFDLAKDLLTRAIDAAAQAEAAGNEDAAGYTCLFLRVRADLRVRFGHLPEAHGDIDAALEIARGPASFRDYEGHLYRTRGDAFRQVGGFEQAQVEYGRALTIARDSGYEWLKAEALIAQGRLALTQGETAEAIAMAERAKNLAKAGGWWLEQGRACVLRGEAALATGAASVREDVPRGLELAEASGHHLLISEASHLFDEWMEGRA